MYPGVFLRVSGTRDDKANVILNCYLSILYKPVLRFLMSIGLSRESRIRGFKCDP